MPGAVFDASWHHIGSYRNGKFRPEDFPVVTSLLRHGCALRCESNNVASHFVPIAQHMVDTGRTFRAKAVILESFRHIGSQEFETLHQLLEDIGVKDFDLRADNEFDVPLILDDEWLHRAERFHLDISVRAEGITPA